MCKYSNQTGWVIAAIILVLSMISSHAIAIERLPVELKKQLLLHQYSGVIPKLKTLANKGNNEARYQLALCYLNGLGTEVSAYSAVKLLKQASDKGHSKSSYLLGTLYYQGDVIEKNISAAKSYLFIAEQKGHHLAKKLSLKIDHLNSNTSFSTKEAQQRLEYAARSGDKSRAEDALRSGANINSKNSQGDTPLVIASKNKQYDFIRWFITKKPNVKYSDNNKNTALHFICLAGEEKLAVSLLKLNPPLNLQNNNGRTPLINAVISGNSNLVKLLLDYGAQPEINDNQQKNAFDYAENKKGTGILKALAPFRKNVSNYKNLQQRLQQLTMQTNKKDNLYYQWPKIAVAVAQNEKQLVTLLLSQGADPWEKNSAGISAISLAASRNEIDYSSMLLKTPSAYTKQQQKQSLELLIIAAKNNNSNFIQQISKNLPPKLPTQLDFIKTPLWYAVDTKSEQAAIQLVKWQQQDFRADSQGRNLLILAVSLNMQKLSAALLQKGFDVNRTDKFQRSSYWYAADHGYIELMKFLISKHVNIFKQDKDGNTPLHRAVLSGNLGAVKLAISQGAKINQKSNNGNSAIFFSAAKFPDITKFLIQKDADVSLRNRQSYTPLMNAVKNKCIECIKLLLAAGANPSRKNSKGQNSFDLADGDQLILNLLNQ
jgi:ankyrin repeat protein